MTTRIRLHDGEMTWLVGRNGRLIKAGVTGPRARLVWLAIFAAVGLSAWVMLSGPSDAESQPVAASSPVVDSSQDASWFNPATTPIQAALATPADETAAAEAAPVDGLKISSQSWRRGGLGSKALVTFTVRNRNDYAVRDIEISCAFSRSDGSHLTDRKRTVHDTVNTRSQRTFARMLVGFVNISANSAKCALVTATRL
jgi:hypothetical protein